MLNLTLERIERQIRDLPVEHAYAFDADYRILWHATDNRASQVMFSPEQLESLDGAILTHNHPGGRSLSRIDVLLARRWNLDEIRAVTTASRFSVRPPVEGWSSTANEEFRAVLDWETQLLDRRVEKEVERGALTALLAELTFHHRLWERMSARGLLRYTAAGW